jgi:type I restriction enzyme R subunit
MKSNFSFLESDSPILADPGSIAESHLCSDANSCLIKLGLFGETVVNLMMQMDNISAPLREHPCKLC